MAFSAEATYANEYEFMDGVLDAILYAADAHSTSTTQYEVKVRWKDPQTQPQYGGVRVPISQTESILGFWKGESGDAPDPDVDDKLTVDSVNYRIGRVMNHRNGSWTLFVNKERINRV